MEKPLLVHKNENLMYGLCVLTSISMAIYLLISIIGAIIFIAVGIISLFSHAISMSHIQVNGVRLRESQFPELYQKVVVLSRKMELRNIPEVYIIESGGLLNAFATRVFGFFGKNMVVLYSDFVDIGLDSEGKELDYVIAHELAHIKRNHIVKSLLIFPAMWVPFIGTSYLRMAEYTCDRMAAYYTENPESAINGLLILAAGKRLYRNVHLSSYLEQYNEKKGIFVTLTELLSTHPPIPKRIHEIETFMFDNPTVALIKRGKQTFAIIFLIFFIFPAIVSGLAIAGVMAFDEFGSFLDELPYEMEYTPLMEASLNGEKEKVIELLEAGEDPNEMNEIGDSALLLAVTNEQIEIIPILLEHGADPNLHDESGWTPLMSAVMMENREIGKLLLEAGADPSLKDEFDMSSIDHAKEIGSKEFEELLNLYIKN
jgi:Zn-dependent protease with chaperone function